MRGDVPAVGLARDQEQRVVGGFLWALLVLLLASNVVDSLRFGRGYLQPSVVAANLAVVLFILGAVHLNRSGRTRLAVSLAAGLLMLAASALPLTQGLADSAPSLLVFFVPLVTAGLLLDRFALRVTAGWALAVVVAAPLLHGESLFGDGGDGGVWYLLGPFVMVFAFVAFLLDRFGLRFKESMREAFLSQARAQAELLEEKGFTDAIIESLPGLFFVRDRAGRYVRWNRRFAELAGYSDDELRSLEPLALFEPASRDVAAAGIERVFSEGQATAEVRFMGRDGRVHPYFVSAARVERSGRQYLVGTAIDRSDIDAARASIESLNVALQERVGRLTALRDIDRAIIGSLDIGLTLGVLLEQVTSRLRVPAARILLYDEVEQALRFGASHGLAGVGARGLRVALGQGPSGTVARDRRRVVVTGRDAVAAVVGVEEGACFESYVGVPLVAKGRLQGVLEVLHDQPLPESDDWHDFLDALAMQAAIGVSNARLFEELERSNVELRLAYDTTIEGWARALDLKDQETEGHSRRVTELAVQLAARLGLRGEDLVQVRRGALLHDIGKMGVPDAILLKPGKLDPDEWEVMKSHTTLAYELLSGIPFLRSAIDIPYAHHERWDGTGYPRGLKGEEIPIGARLFAVVDVYDALTSDRPYRRAWSREKALAYIRDNAGTHFDPRVVDAFLEMMGEREEPARVAARRDPRGGEPGGAEEPQD